MQPPHLAKAATFQVRVKHPNFLSLNSYYIREPLVSTKPKAASQWMIFHEGGGWCLGDENCHERANSSLGSSTFWPAVPPGTMPPGVSYEGEEMYASETFATATIVYAKYCDGGSWSGDNDTATVVDGRRIYYRGRRLLDALFTDLLSRGLAEADELVYSGCSAGALTAYLHLDYIAALLPARTTVVGLADAMFVLDHSAFPGNATNYNSRQFSWGLTAWNSTQSLSTKCLAHYGQRDGWKCMLGAVAAQFLEHPLMVRLPCSVPIRRYW